MWHVIHELKWKRKTHRLIKWGYIFYFLYVEILTVTVFFWNHVNRVMQTLALTLTTSIISTTKRSLYQFSHSRWAPFVYQQAASISCKLICKIWNNMFFIYMPFSKHYPSLEIVGLLENTVHLVLWNIYQKTLIRNTL